MVEVTDRVEDEVAEIVIKFERMDAVQQEEFLAELEQLKQKYMEDK